MFRELIDAPMNRWGFTCAVKTCCEDSCLEPEDPIVARDDPRESCREASALFETQYKDFVRKSPLSVAKFCSRSCRLIQGVLAGNFRKFVASVHASRWA